LSPIGRLSSSSSPSKLMMCLMVPPP
jgi:hypothetical protein